MELQLGVVEAVDQGRLPIVEAKTMYGSGNLLLLHSLMRYLDYSYAGALAAQSVVNAVVISALVGLLFWFAGPLIGLIAFFSFDSFASPVGIASYSGWGWLPRWFSSACILCMIAESIHSRGALRALGMAITGILFGGAVFISQEAVGVCLIAAAIIFALSIGNGTLSLSKALPLLATLLLSAGVSFLALVVACVGFENILIFVKEYFAKAALVREGVSNTYWPEGQRAGRFLTEYSLYLISSFGFPLAIALYAFFGRAVDSPLLKAQSRIFVGLIAGGASFLCLAHLRTDLTHFRGASMMLSAALASVAIVLPFLTRVPLLAKIVLAAGASGILVGAFSGGGTLKVHNRLLHMGYPPTLVDRTVERIRDLQGVRLARINRLHDDDDILLRRLAYRPEQRERLKSATIEGQLIRAAFFREAVGNRSAFVTGNNMGLTLFLGDIRVGTSVIEPRISIWLASERAEWAKAVEEDEPDCLISYGMPTTERNLVGLEFIRRNEPRLEILRGPGGYNVYCKAA